MPRNFDQFRPRPHKRMLVTSTRNDPSLIAALPVMGASGKSIHRTAQPRPCVRDSRSPESPGRTFLTAHHSFSNKGGIHPLGWGNLLFQRHVRWRTNMRASSVVHSGPDVVLQPMERPRKRKKTRQGLLEKGGCTYTNVARARARKHMKNPTLCESCAVHSGGLAPSTRGAWRVHSGGLACPLGGPGTVHSGPGWRALPVRVAQAPPVL